MERKKSLNKQNKKRATIGGQAVLEGVMMRGERAMATAVRDADGIIRVESKRITPLSKKNVFFRLPIVRGVVSFITSMVCGVKVLMRSAEVYGDAEPSKTEKWIAEKLKIDLMSVVSFISLILGLGLAVLLFTVLPQLVLEGIERLVGNGFKFGLWARNFIEGGVKILVFIVYILLSTLLKDIRRTFMYHGAEHKTISCYEKGLELTVENAKSCTRVHDRCGTTFMVFVITISILVFALFESLVVGQALSGALRVVCKLALLPVVAGLSYELLRGLAKTDCWVFYPLKLPGLLLQRITTREPDKDMIEVAITAFKTVQEMDADPSIQEKEFVVSKKRSVLLKEIKTLLSDKGITEEAEAEWILAVTLNVDRDKVNSNDIVSPKQIDQIYILAQQRLSGKPLWYCVGDTSFYGYDIKVDERVLIPRAETELLVYEAKKHLNQDKAVLDLCTGSGAIAIAINKETGANLTACDISEGALALAKENAQANGAEVNFIKSDMFENVNGKFDLIVSNPPYIKSAVIQTLQSEVKDFEPMIALDGGVDGLDFYRIIAKEAKSYLNKGGILLLEIGYDQANDVKALLEGFWSVEIIKDYENNDRIIKAVF